MRTRLVIAGSIPGILVLVTASVCAGGTTAYSDRLNEFIGSAYHASHGLRASTRSLIESDEVIGANDTLFCQISSLSLSHEFSDDLLGGTPDLLSAASLPLDVSVARRTPLDATEDFVEGSSNPVAINVLASMRAGAHGSSIREARKVIAGLMCVIGLTLGLSVLIKICEWTENCPDWLPWQTRLGHDEAVDVSILFPHADRNIT